jgi:hypothetical protein
LPAVLVICLVVWLAQRDISQLLLFLPGILLMPLVALVPALLHRGMPLSLPNEEAKSAGRTVKMFAVMLLAAVLSGITSWAFSAGWFGWLIVAELLVVIPAYVGGRMLVSKLRWRPAE